jgi:erythromycin esterase
MLNRRRLLFGGTGIAAAALASAPVALHALARQQPYNLPVSDEIVAWLNANAIPLATTEPCSGFKDIEFLRAAVGDARIVSLGEATHGTREFFQLKHRVIEYCVAELGFTMVAFEANYGDTLAVNDYVLEGKGSAAQVVAGMGFWIWNTEEVVALVEWIRAWNIAHNRKVTFYGFDMQECRSAARHLLGYLHDVAPEVARASEPALATLPPSAWAPVGDDLQARIVAQIANILASFDGERALWVTRSSESKWHEARQCAVVVEQCVRCSKLSRDSMAWRDRCMAKNVRSLLHAEGPQAKALLWAHNGHVKRTPWIPGVTSMGAFLHDDFAAQQVVVGFSFNQGTYRLPESDTVGPAPPGFLDAALARTGLPLLALDLSRVPTSGPVAAWMASKPYQRFAGAGKPPEPHWYELLYWFELFYPPFGTEGNPQEECDILMFVETTTPSRPQRG